MSALALFQFSFFRGPGGLDPENGRAGSREARRARGEGVARIVPSRVSVTPRYRSLQALLRSPDTVINRVGSGRTRDREGTNGSADGLIAMSALRNRFPGGKRSGFADEIPIGFRLRRICTGEYVWETRSFGVCWRDGYDK